MTRRRLALAGVLSASVLLSGCDFDGAYDLPLPGSPVDADEAIEVTAEFDDVLNVVPRSPVMVDDVVVGEVTEVERSDWHARITLRVRDDVALPDNAIAEIRQVSLLGEKYVALEEPTGEEPRGRLGDGDEIGLDRTGRNPEVEEVLGALSFLLSGGGVAQLGTITRELNLAMSGREGELRDLLGSLERVIGTLDEQKGDILSALESINDLTATLNRERSTVEDALDVTGPAVRVLADQHRELVGMLSSLDRLGVVGTRVIGASKDDLISMLRDLRPVLANLRRAGDQLGPGLNLLLSFPFPKEASAIVQGDFANTFIKADINLDNFIDRGPDRPDLPIPELPDIPIVRDLPQVIRNCLTSGSLLSRACLQALRSALLLPELRRACRRPALRDNPVCRALGTLGGRESGGGGGGTGGGGNPLDPLLPDVFRRGASGATAGGLDELIGGAP